MALVMSDVAHLDSWDIASASGLLRHAASHLGLEGGDLIRSVAALAVPDVARHMAGAADAHDLPIATGCNVVLTKYGFGLVGWWLHDYAPTCDLTGLTIELAELVEADQDEVESIVLAADVPIVWLPAPGHLDVAACLARVRAAASLNAGMLTGQMLMLFVAECSSPADAARLAESVSLTHLHDCARLAAAVGPLFGLAVARATFQGKSTVETDASLGASVRVSSQH